MITAASPIRSRCEAAGSRAIRRALLLLTLPVALLLSACSSNDSPQAMLNNYLWRISNVLDVDAPQLNTPAVLTPPRTRDRRLPVGEFRVDILDFLSVQGCDLGRVIGQRNSSLGKVMPASQRLVYELSFLNAAGNCLPSIENDDPTFFEELSGILQAKRAELPRHIWNAVFAGPEFAQLMSPSAGLPLADQDETADAALQALLELESLLQSVNTMESSRTLDQQHLEDTLAKLSRSAAGGQAMLRMRALTQTLDAARQMIDTAVENRTLCPMQRTTKRGEYLRNVFDLFYAGDIQPYSVPAFRTEKQLLETLQRLAALTGASPPDAMTPYWTAAIMTGDGSAFADLERALKAHTNSWQRALGECQLMPGQTAPAKTTSNVQ